MLNTHSFARGAAAAALLAVSAAASALPSFTFNPSAVGLSGDTFTADNLLISDYATITSGSTTFAETGFLRITGAQLEDTTLAPAGLNTGYTLFISFSGTGTQDSAASPLTQSTTGTFTSLDYTMWAYKDSATFSFSGTTPTTSATDPSKLVKLASGSLIEGGVSTRPSGGSFSTAADASLTFSTESGSAGFFASPNPFFNQAMTSFTNTSSQVQPFAGGFMIRQGGGSINFASAVPEPQSYAMLIGGLLAIGSVVRRRGTKR